MKAICYNTARELVETGRVECSDDDGKTWTSLFRTEDLILMCGWKGNWKPYLIFRTTAD
jgi:hypothetical protein